MTRNGYVDLAVVSEYNTGAKYLVVCPGFCAQVGGIVEFEAESCLNLGRIDMVMSAKPESEEMAFAESMMETIPCTRLWKPLEVEHESA